MPEFKPRAIELLLFLRLLSALALHIAHCAQVWSTERNSNKTTVVVAMVIKCFFVSPAVIGFIELNMAIKG